MNTKRHKHKVDGGNTKKKLDSLEYQQRLLTKLLKTDKYDTGFKLKVIKAVAKNINNLFLANKLDDEKYKSLVQQIDRIEQGRGTKLLAILIEQSVKEIEGEPIAFTLKSLEELKLMSDEDREVVNSEIFRSKGVLTFSDPKSDKEWAFTESLPEQGGMSNISQWLDNVFSCSDDESKRANYCFGVTGKMTATCLISQENKAFTLLNQWGKECTDQKEFESGVIPSWGRSEDGKIDLKVEGYFSTSNKATTLTIPIRFAVNPQIVMDLQSGDLDEDMMNYTQEFNCEVNIKESTFTFTRANPSNRQRSSSNSSIDSMSSTGTLSDEPEDCI